jgi:hypothetical protein
MALERSARAGTDITLRAKIFDDLGETAEASGLLVYLFEPGVDSVDTALALDSGTPTYWDEGIFEFAYSIPPAGPDGLWTDKWFATLDEMTISGTFIFEVSASGQLVSIGNQLHINNIVDVTVPSGIMATDGSILEEPYSFSFMTTISPAYTDANKLLLEVGGALRGIQDDTIYMAILEASLEANLLTFRQTNLNGDFYLHARREWTTCRAAASLATNARAQAGMKRKKLGDLEVEYDLSAVNDLLDRVAACLARWEPQLMSGGYAKQVAVGFIKGELDPDRPHTGRAWSSRGEIPAANNKSLAAGHRRWKKGFRSNW